MIHLQRARTAKHIPPSFRDPKRTTRNVALITTFQAPPFKPKSSLWKSAKKALSRESKGKCAYCETPAGASAHCDVEHFRPKSKYWWLTLCYDNYVFACQICNQMHKKDYFPISGVRLVAPALVANATPAQLQALAAAMSLEPMANAAAIQAWEQALNTELPDLPDPYHDDPGRWFAWEADDVLKEVRLVPRDPQNARCRTIVAAAEQYLGLNREQLLQLRYRMYGYIAAFRDLYQAADIPAHHKNSVATQLSTSMETGASFAGMARHFVRNVWNLPIPVPP